MIEIVNCEEYSASFGSVFTTIQKNSDCPRQEILSLQIFDA